MRIRLFSLLVIFAFALSAQNAGINGLVRDQSQAAVPGATVKVTNLDTGLQLTAITNEAGNYTVPLLPVGRYSVATSKEGFGTETQPEIKLDTQQVARLDFTLKPGAIVESVDVSATAALLDSETSTVGQVINTKQIVDLPLNGRNYLTLSLLTAGTAPDTRGRTGSEGGFSASGQHQYQVNITVDGLDNTTRSSGGPLGYEAQVVKPSIDAVQEFRVVTNNLSAEYGYRMGGQVFVTTRSGTNQIHGTGYEFLRNDKLDGTNFFANANGAGKPPYKQNQFGGTMGGPIWKNHTFLFGSFEGTRIRLGDSFISTVPTALERQGDFSGIRPIFDPATTAGTGANMTRQVFPGNVIPKSRWDPLFPKLLALYPLPITGGISNNFFYSPTDRDDTNQYDFRGDQLFGSSSRLSARYSRRDRSQYQNGPLPLPADGGLSTTTGLTAHSGVVSFTQNLSPSLNHEARFGTSVVTSAFDIPYDKPLFGDYGITGIPTTNSPLSNNHGLSLFTPQGYAQLGSRAFWPNFNDLTLYQLSDTAFKIYRNHTIKFGFDYRHEAIYRNAARFSRGQFIFNREFTSDPKNRAATGDGLAEFMLGTASSGNVSNENGEDIRVNSVAGFVQDDWKVTPQLTLNLGLRYDVFLAPTYPGGQVSNYILNFSKLGPDARLQQIRPKDGSDCLCDNNYNNLAPRVGFAYRLKNKTVIRSGFGIIYAQADNISTQIARGTNQAPDYVQISFATVDRINPRLTLSGGFPAVQLPAASVPGPALVGATVRDPYIPSQYSAQWFFDVQRELPFSMLLTAGYQGNGTHHLTSDFDNNLPFGPSTATVASRRLFPFYTNVFSTLTAGNLSYNAMTLKLEKRFSRGVQFLSAFTLAHALDNVTEVYSDNGPGGGGPVNPYNRQLNRGNSDLDVRRNFVLSSTWELPAGKGKRWLNRGGIVDAALGGWQLAGILSVRSGLPFTVITTGGLTNAGGEDRPNRIGNGALDSSQRNINQWFDTSAFQVQPQYTYGNSGRNILVGPGVKNIDFSLQKFFAVTERFRLQFRAEAFNLTNTPTFGQPNNTLNGTNPGVITTAGQPRRIQFGLKLIF